ncbi:MAG TPA: hypothetical protein VFJ64_03045 [Solirubrobacterales bacterium]|nr:hypothetical protein [Solirubrobacterales bacterium]
MSGAEWKALQRAEDWSSCREGLPLAGDAEAMLVEQLIHVEVGLRDALRDAGYLVAYAVLREPLPVCLARVRDRESGSIENPAAEQLWRSFSDLVTSRGTRSTWTARTQRP